MLYSIIIAVYNRPEELGELLASLSQLTYKQFEVIVVEDGSAITSEQVCAQWRGCLTIHYVTKDNGGPGLARNVGCMHAHGDVFIFLDSDCTVPPEWLQFVHEGMQKRNLDAFGGPDREHPSFLPIQKAISYAMTSLFTTGGIRGSKRRVGGAFHPRSFNMGIKRKVYETTRGFSAMRFGEDIDLSLRIIEAGFRVDLIPEAWVYHKRRTDLTKFYRQVFNSGMARVNLTYRHPGTLKLLHFFPAAFVTYSVFAILYSLFVPLGWYSLAPLIMYILIIQVHATLRYHSFSIGALSTLASVVQLYGYGLGFITGIIQRSVLGKPEGWMFSKTFYK